MWRKGAITIGVLIAGLLFAAPVEAASFDIVPASGQITATCSQTLQIFADVTGQSSNTADLIVYFNPSLVQVSQVQPGGAYSSYVANQLDNSLGRIRMTALSIGNNLTSRKLFATVQYATIGAATNVQFNIQFNGAGATTDSNIADSATSLDILTSVTNANFLVVPGSCNPDTTAPTVQFIAPTGGQQDFPANTSQQVRILDSLSGVNLSSVTIVIDGQTYTSASPEMDVSGMAANYLFTIGVLNLAPGSHTMVVSGKDIAGNSFSQQNNFVVVAPSTSSTSSSASTSTTSSTTATVTTTSTSSSTSNPPECICSEPGLINLPPVANIVQGTIFDNTVIETVLIAVDQNVGTASTAAAVTGLAVLVSLLPYFSLLSAPGLLANVISFLLGKKRDKSWGVIIDGATRAPVVFATCRVYLYGAKTFVAQTVSDTAGRYGFALSPGKYRMEVLHDKYVKHISEIVVETGKATPVKDIVIYPLNLLHGRTNRLHILQEAREAFAKFWKQTYPTIFVLGFVLAILGFVSIPSLINSIILILYVLLSMFAMFRKQLASQAQASLVDAQSNLRIPGAVIKIYNPKNWEVIDTQTTNENGMFDYWGEPGEYALLAVVRGYTFPSKLIPPTRVAKHGKLELPLFKMKTGGNNIVLYADPLEENEVVGYNGPKPINLANPFE